MRGPDHQVDAADEGCSVEMLDMLEIWAHDYYLSDPAVDPAFLTLLRHAFPRLHTPSWTATRPSRRVEAAAVCRARVEKGEVS